MGLHNADLDRLRQVGLEDSAALASLGFVIAAPLVLGFAMLISGVRPVSGVVAASVAVSFLIWIFFWSIGASLPAGAFATLQIGAMRHV